MILFKLAFRKHPVFLKTLLQRNDEYNKTLDYCEQMEQQGRLFMIAPSPEFTIGRTEPSLEKRVGLYNHGYIVMRKEFDPLHLFMKKPTAPDSSL